MDKTIVLFLVVALFWILYKFGVPFLAFLEINNTLVLRRKRKIINGTPKISYIVLVQDVKIPINKINFVNSLYKEALLNDEIEDLNIVIQLGNKELYLDGKQLMLYSPPFFPFSLFRKNKEKYLLIRFDYKKIEADLQNVKEAKVLTRSGKTIIGESSVRVEIR